MSTPVGGGINIPLTGDTSGLTAAVREAAGELQKLQAKHQTLEKAVEEASAALGKEHAVVKALQAQAAGVSKSFQSMTGSGDGLRDMADKVDQKLGKVQIVMGGLAQAAGGTGGALQEAVGGFADLAMSIAGGLGAIGLAVGAFALLNKYIADADEKAKALDERWKSAMAPLVARGNELKKQTDTLRVQLDVEKALTEAGPGSRHAAALANAVRARAEFAEETRKAIEKEKELNGILAETAERVGKRIVAEGGAGNNGADVERNVSRIMDEEGAATKEKVDMLRAEVAKLKSNASQVEESTRRQTELDAAVEKRTLAEEAYQRQLAKNLARLAEANAGAPMMDSAAAEFKANVPAGGNTAQAQSSMEQGYYAEQRGKTADSRGVSSAMFPEGDGPLTMGKTPKQLKELGENTRQSSEELADFKYSLERAGEAAAMIQQHGGAIASGNGMEGIGSALLGAIGGAVGTAIAPGIGTAVGSAIGSLLGGIFGSALDDLIGTLDILRPLFDGVSVVIATMQPVLLVLKLIFEALGQVLVSLAPVLLQAFRAVAMIILPVVRIFQMLVLALLQFMPILEVLMLGMDLFGWVMQGVDDALRFVVGSLLSMVNSIIDMVNSITEMGRKVFGDNFGVLIDHVEMDFSDISEDFYNSTEDLKGKVDENTQAVDANTQAETGQTLSNIPTGIKIADTSFQSAGGVQVGTVNIIARGTAAQEMESLRNRNFRGTAQSLGRNTIKDSKN